MSADLAARLRALARDHHEGRLNLPTYRKLRAPLLDSLQLHAMDEMAVTQPRSLGRAAGSPAPTRKNTVAPSPPRPSKSPRVIFAVVALLLIAAVAWWVVRPSTPHEQVAADSVAPTNPVREVVEPFVQRGDWSDARVADLNVTLLELGQAQIGAVGGERWFQSFVDEVRKRIKEQQALVQAPLTARSSPLAALAVTVGLDLNSPDAAIRTVNRFRTSESEAESETQSETQIADAPPASAAKKTDVESRAQKTDSAAASKTAPVAAPIAAAPRKTTCRPELIRSRRPFCHDTLSSGKNGPQLALIPAGEFDMGSVAAASEKPVHRVTIRESFAMSVHEISQAEFNEFCQETGRSCAAQLWSADDYPAANVSWQDARAYAEWLSSSTGFQYRLPSEAQWEYAARAGETRLVPGVDKLAPTDAHFSMLTNLTAPAPRSQRFNDNAFRLMHTLGNLREWVEDVWTDNYSDAPSDGAAVISSASNNMRVARGGSYADGAATLRLSMREGLPSDTRDALTGFRVLREVP